ncbi:hypothetical protein PC9H_008832 [Pleurotus ostreatus]|uniref:Protein kinase domain-containing protein n=1 Tax=Pleurotus ostreatus TaxID=5322 RepID=A0A8H6ZPP5_PLEOS|nr:uncharacterized protein PC9H_008832 [Pleurotus ostreatus]KAF7426463.1 hypothetical protein PC9H_008832 [Pleurotus ostreatus]
MATRRTSVKNLRRIRADWRQVVEDCTAYSTTERLAKIREADKYSEDQVFMLSYCAQVTVVDSIRRQIKPLSTSAKHEEYLVHAQQAKHPEAIYNGHTADLTGPSIAIYHPIFAIFQRALSQTPLPGDISREDLDSASLFISLSTQYYTTEPERQYAISSVVEALLGPSFVFRETLVRCGIISFTLDGNRRANFGLFKPELENGIGLGESDPIEQGETAYLSVATAPELEKLRNRSCMPSFLLEISGPYLSVSGAIYVDGVITERLTGFISLVPLLSSQAPLGHASAHDKLTYQIAHFFQCLRECSDQLAAEYLKMDPMDIVDERILLPAHHFSRSERTVFLAKAERAGQPTIDCIVKFASAYCADVHNIVHEAGAAPRLLYCEFVPSVGKFCVVTEFVHEQEGARLTSAGIQTLQNAVGALHARSHVFGDLRDANILVDGQGNPNLIDFDWSGIEGNVFYLMNINERIGWQRRNKTCRRIRMAVLQRAQEAWGLEYGCSSQASIQLSTVSAWGSNPSDMYINSQ